MTDVNPRQDFYDVMTDYLRRAAADGVVRAEIFFDPQTHCFGDVSGSAVDPAAEMQPRCSGDAVEARQRCSRGTAEM